MKPRLLLAALVMLVAGCATAPPPVPGAALNDTAFAPPSEPVNADAVFELSPAMREYLRGEITQRVRLRGKQRALATALFESGQLRLDFDAAVTRTAAQAFDERAGNCLSLVILTTAFAKEMGLPVEYRVATNSGMWMRVGELLFHSGHVNIRLLDRLADRNAKVLFWPVLTIDFLPPEALAGLRTRAVQEHTILAMYLNNRAAEMLAEGRVDDAYWHVREALRRDPQFASAWNTLGVVQLRRGDGVRAERALREALALEGDNPRALSNLVAALEQRGDTAAARATRERLSRLEPEAPMAAFDRGVAAARRGDWVAAREAFQHELRRSDYSAEVHYWMALTELQDGSVDLAKKALESAIQRSMTPQDRRRFTAKLDALAAPAAR